MEKYLCRSLIMTLIMVLPLLVNAQDRSEKQVEAQMEKLRVAMIDADEATLSKLASEKLTYGHSNADIEDKKKFIQRIISGASDFTEITVQEQTITVNGDVAHVRQKVEAKLKSGETINVLKLHILLVWQKQGKDWVLFARQAVRLP
ncbi:MAG TPA: nuclear transport factor 2 family protein [Chitinophagaceae bacterium]|nr:nuclear transport factor 2 family protein [Chitinophagaceae bacterium]